MPGTCLTQGMSLPALSKRKVRFLTPEISYPKVPTFQEVPKRPKSSYSFDVAKPYGSSRTFVRTPIWTGESCQGTQKTPLNETLMV